MTSVISKMGFVFLEQGFSRMLVPICISISICCSASGFYYQVFSNQHLDALSRRSILTFSLHKTCFSYFRCPYLYGISACLNHPRTAQTRFHFLHACTCLLDFPIGFALSVRSPFEQTQSLKHGRALVVSACAAVASIVTGVLAGMQGEQFPSAPTARFSLLLGW